MKITYLNLNCDAKTTLEYNFIFLSPLHNYYQCFFLSRDLFYLLSLSPCPRVVNIA